MREGSVVADRFELIAPAGSGGTSSVYRARDRETGRTVAVKVLDRQQPFDLARFSREAKLLATVHHPNVVEYVAHGDVAGTHYLVQAWIEGSTLGQTMLGGGLTAREAVTVAIGVADAAAATHALGVIHRDIKPSNILLEGGSPERVRLVDFGIARLASEAGILTRTGTMIGTPSYMSPEQARGHIQIDARTDVWAIGCVLYETLAGKSPFAGNTPEAIRAKVLLNQPPPVPWVCPEAPPELVALVEAMLDKDPAKRPASGAELAARLRALPEVADGPRRRRGTPEPATVVMSDEPTHQDVARCFLMFAPIDEDSDPRERVLEIATRHDLEVHTFEDASALLACRSSSPLGALHVARAALDLREEVPESAVSVFGQTTEEALDQALDRGSTLLERAKISALFEDTAGGPIVRMDPAFATLIDTAPLEEVGLAIAQTPEGPVLRARA